MCLFIILICISLVQSVKIDVAQLVSIDMAGNEINNVKFDITEIVGHDKLTFSSLNDEPSIIFKVIRPKETEAHWAQYRFTAYNKEQELLTFEPFDLTEESLYMSPHSLILNINDGFVQYLDNSLEMKQIQPLKGKRHFRCRRPGIVINSKEMGEMQSNIDKMISIEDIFTDTDPSKQGIEIMGYDKKGNQVKRKWYQGDEKPSLYIRKTKDMEWKKYMLTGIQCLRDKTLRVLPYLYVFEAKDGSSASIQWKANDLMKACADERVAFNAGGLRKKITLITGHADPSFLEQAELDEMFAADQNKRDLYSGYEYGLYDDDLQYDYRTLSRLLRYYESLRNEYK